MDLNLESLYQEAQSALKAKDYDRASDLLRQILKTDVDYKDTAQLLARVTRLSRRKWYNDPRLWGVLGVLVLVGLGIYIFPKLQGLASRPEPSPVILPTGSPPPTISLPATSTPTATSIPSPTPVPLTWKRISIGQEFKRDKIIAFEIDPKDPDVLYVQMENAGFYQSIDGGISWSPVEIKSISLDIAKKLAVNNDHNQEAEYTVTNIGPDGKKRSYSVKTANWFISENGGTSWSEFGMVGKPQSNAITFDADGSLYVYCDASLCKYSVDGKQKTTLGKPDVGAFTIIKISPFDQGIIYVAGDGISISKDGGLTWTKLNNGLGSKLVTLETGEGNPPALYLLQVEDCENLGFPYITRQDRTKEPGQPLYMSEDGGQTWSLISDSGCNLIKDADGITFYRIARAIEFCNNCEWPDGWIWRSQNGGRSWERITIPRTYWNLLMIVAHPTQSGTLFALNSDPREFFTSTDYGNKFEKTNSASRFFQCGENPLEVLNDYRSIAIDPRDDNHIFVIRKGKLSESLDGCKTANALAAGLHARISTIAVDRNTAGTLYVGTNQGSYISFDSGQTWTQINDGLLGATVVYSIVVDRESNVYAATPYGIFKLEGK